jgi:hypothetical protein
MIALGLLTTWLTLTAAGFAGLSALRRAGAREDEYDESPVPAGRQTPTRTFSGARVSIPSTLLR